MRKAVVPALAACVFAATAAAQQPSDASGPVGFSPYRSSSVLARDLFSPQPGRWPALYPPEDGSGAAAQGYGLDTFGGHLRAVPLELGVVAGMLAATGFSSWDWGSSKFKVAREGWFGKNTHSGGMDKLGHFYTTFVISEMLGERMAANSANPAGAHLTAAIVGFGLMAAVEVGDGFSRKYGFSPEDLAANAAGAAFALARAAWPELKRTVDFRFMPTLASDERPGVKAPGFQLIPPYRRTRYVLAVKFSGFEGLRATPLRYAELHLGFQSRGFHAQEKKLGYPKERSFYVGVGLNLNELLFADGPLPNFARWRDTEPAWALEHALRYIQIPYTAAHRRLR
jgi:hypothetical protein